MPGLAGPRRASGDSPSGKYGIVVVAESNTGRATAGGAPGARGGGFWPDAGRAIAAAQATARMSEFFMVAK